MDDRIKLAEAMGWEPNNNAHGIHTLQVNKGYPDDNGPWVDEPGFFPFTDANDDYAVLEWMRDKCGVNKDDDQYTEDDVRFWDRFAASLPNVTDNGAMYEIGDYARAALKVIDAQKERDE